MLRIRKKRWKAAYFAAFFVAANLVISLVWPVVSPTVARLVLVALTVLVYAGAVRTFRGRGESIAPPRAWWRMTARPTAGFLLGAFYILSVVWGVVSTIVEYPGEFPVSFWTVIPLTIGALFLNSSIRLVRFPPVPVPDPVRLAKRKPIKP